MPPSGLSLFIIYPTVFPWHFYSLFCRTLPPFGSSVIFHSYLNSELSEWGWMQLAIPMRLRDPLRAKFKSQSAVAAPSATVSPVPVPEPPKQPEEQKRETKALQQCPAVHFLSLSLSSLSSLASISFPSLLSLTLTLFSRPTARPVRLVASVHSASTARCTRVKLLDQSKRRVREEKKREE